jgi:hypothetical protein
MYHNADNFIAIMGFLRIIGSQVKKYLDSLPTESKRSTDFETRASYALLKLITSHCPLVSNIKLYSNPTYSTNDALFHLLHGYDHKTVTTKLPQVRDTLKRTKHYVSWIPAHAPVLSGGAVGIPGTNAILQPASAESIPFSFSVSDFHHILSINSVDCGKMFEWFMENDIPIPLGLLCFTPHMEYIMGTMFMMRGGGEAGWTYYGHADFQLGDSVHNKMHYGHFTMYMKCVVQDAKMIIHARDIFCRRYVQGNGHRVWNALDTDDVEPYQSDEMVKDMFLVAIPMNMKFEGVWFMDIRGKHHESISCDLSNQAETSYPGASAYARHWGWDANDQLDPLDAQYQPEAYAPHFQTLVFQAYMGHYDHHTKQYTKRICNSGHWGPKTGPGTAEGRSGKSMYIPTPAWQANNTFAVAAQGA